MKNWKRIFLVCFITIGGTAIFVYYTLNQFNKALDNLSVSSFAIAKISPSPSSNKTDKDKEQIPTSTPETILTFTSTSTPETISTSTSTPETISTSATLTDLKPSFIFPKKNNELYAGCTYQLSFQLPTTIRSLETTLIDAGSFKTLEPTASNLAKENKIETNPQSLDWKVGAVWPGKYYIQASNIDGVELESGVFTIKWMPKDISADERKKICKKSVSFIADAADTP